MSTAGFSRPLAAPHADAILSKADAVLEEWTGGEQTNSLYMTTDITACPVAHIFEGLSRVSAATS